MTRHEWVWIVAIALVFALGYGLIPARSDRNAEDSFNNGAPGKRAFYLLVESLLPDVHRNSDGLIPADPEADTLVLLGPARYPSRAQWQSLKSWVEEGRTLVFAARWRDPAVRLEPFGVRVVPYSLFGDFEESDEEPMPDEAGETDEPGTPSTPSTNDETETTDDESTESDEGPTGTGMRLGSTDDDPIETQLVSGEVDWRSRGYVVSDDPNAVGYVLHGGDEQVLVQHGGDGYLVTIASDYLFSNRAQVDPENGLLAFRLLELGIPIGPIYFDEGLNLAGAPRVVGILFEEPFRAVSLQLLTLALLFAWMRGRRFGRPAKSSRPPRRSLVEHAEALGSLHQRVRAGGRLVRAYLEFYRRELGVSQQVGDAAAGALDPDLTEQDRQLVGQAIRASKSPNLDEERVGKLIHRLAKLRARRINKKESP